MAKISYLINTPHGTIKRKSDRVYSHVCYVFNDGKIKVPTFHGSRELAEKQLKQINPGIGFIVEATTE